MKTNRRAVAALVTVGILVGAGGSAFPGQAMAATEKPRATKDHWHSAFGVWSCDHWLPAVAMGDDPTGIHTHGDGLIHVHPFDDRAAGTKATLGRFFEASVIKVDATRIDLPQGPKLVAGSDCNGKKTEIAAAVWRSVKDKQPKLVTKDLASIRLTDGQVIALVHAPKGTTPALPPSIDDLVEPADLPLPPLSASELKSLPPLPPKPAFDLTGTPPAKLVMRDLSVGTGETLVKGSKGYMRFVMYLVRTKQELGVLWKDGEQPYALARFGKKRNLAGLDKGMIGMKVGGVRRIVLPPSEAFGEQGNDPVGPNDLVVFYVQLVAVKK
jgi:FKBP-type peptidyl-prolyl cis-trans isomerase